MLNRLRRTAPPTDDSPGIHGIARVDRRTKNLAKRLEPGEIAIIDHLDIDKVAADSLAACQPGAVLNAVDSISGRYPNLGPEIIIGAGVPLIDGLGSSVMSIQDGDYITVLDGQVLLDGQVVASGNEQSKQSVADAMDAARAGLSTQLEAFVANTMELLRKERDLLLDGVGVPEVRTEFTGRHVLIVVRGYHYKEDLAMLRSYIREYRPVLIGVDGGADAIAEAGYKVDMVIGDMDSVSDKVLTSGAEVVVHAYRDGRAPGLARVENLGVNAVVFPAAATSEDIAMLLADEKGASLMVAVGTHQNLVEFLDKGRGGMASTFLTRLRVGGKLVDAKGVSRLYRQRISTAQLLGLIVAGIVTLGVALSVTSGGQVAFSLIGARLTDFFSWIQGWYVGAPPESMGTLLNHLASNTFTA